jgi:hypothetical protein
MRKLVLAALAMTTASAASAATFIVDAQGNASSGGAGAASLTFTAGQAFTVTVAADDLWSAGALPRWSNADGLTGPRFATGSDESGEAAGTQIGADFGQHCQNGLCAAFGSLVGEIGGEYRVLGTNFSGPAWASGTLNLYYWDSNSSDNAQFVTANVALVPEPAAWALMIGGMGLAGMAIRRRGSAAVAYS